MRFGFGNHPAFNIEGSIDQYWLQFEQQESVIGKVEEGNVSIAYPIKERKLLLSNEMFQNEQTMMFE